jgi:hypothetical protein
VEFGFGSAEGELSAELLAGDPSFLDATLLFHIERGWC